MGAARVSLRQKADEFIKLHGGKPFGEIQGRDGPIAYKVRRGERTFHIYYSRRWYYRPDGISIPEHALEVGLAEDATIVIYVINECVWQYANEWFRLSTDLKNHTHGGTTEKLILKEDLLVGSFNQGRKGMDEFF